MTVGWDRLTPDERRQYTRLFVEWMCREIPGVKIAFKDDPPHTMPWWHRVSHYFARFIARDYDRRFTTVIYPVIYLPSATRQAWTHQPELFYKTLRHEFVHLKDFQRFHLWMALSYVGLLPVFLTMRAFWELRGYTQNMIVALESNGEVPITMVDGLTEIFSGRDYGFMLVPSFVAKRCLTGIRAKVLAGEIKGPYPYGPLNHSPPDLDDVV